MRFIQVGVGGFGSRWVQVLKQNPQAEVVAMVDVNDTALAKACADGGYDQAICHHTLDAALAAVHADAVVVCTPPEHHRAPVIAAMRAGLHVISEKPMADSMENCIAMLEAAYETGQTYVVSQNYRYQPNAWTLANAIRHGRVGEVGQAKIDFYRGVDFKGGFRHSMDFPLVVDMSIHHFDLIRFITGLDPIAVQGTAWNPPWSNYRGDCSSSLVFEMSNGARVVYNASWCAKGQFSNWDAQWQIEGAKGTLRYLGDDIRLYQVPELYTVTGEEKLAPESLSLMGQDWVLDNFIGCIGTGQRPPNEVYDNIHSIAMVYAAVEALKSGRRVDILADERVRKILAERARM